MPPSARGRVVWPWCCSACVQPPRILLLKLCHELQLSRDGNALTVRGYVGLPLGQSQTWKRVQ
jgi:hypothetical protein